METRKDAGYDKCNKFGCKDNASQETYGAQAGYLRCNEALKTVCHVRMCGNTNICTDHRRREQAGPFFVHLLPYYPIASSKRQPREWSRYTIVDAKTVKITISSLRLNLTTISTHSDRYQPPRRSYSNKNKFLKCTECMTA